MTGRIEGGRRLSGRPRPVGAQSGPAISIVTIVFNGAEDVRRTLDSVAGQTYDNLEFIVVDGGSTDGTVAIIRRYEASIDYWVSEPDKGIYDAMNKGVALATGEWVCFMNAGDRFFNEESVARAFADAPRSAELIYGDCLVDFGGMSERLAAKDLDQLWKGMICSHQSLFARRTLLVETPFDQRHGAVADFAFTLHARESGRVFHRTAGVVSIVSADGVSDANRLRTLRHVRDIALRYRPGIGARLHFASRFAVEGVKMAAKRLFGRSFVRSVQRYRSWRSEHTPPHTS
jgi:glycosyltransferase involved in cell wall biosynthesis